MRWMIGSLAMALTIERRAGGCRRQTLAASARLDSTTGMTPNRLRAATAFDPHLTPPALAAWLSVFRSCFTAPVWNRVLVLVAGAVLAPGKRTVTQALRVMGLGEAPQFRRYHEVLDRARWDARAVARQLLLYVLDRLLPTARWSSGLTTPSSGAASIVTRCGPRRDTSSKPVGCAGFH